MKTTEEKIVIMQAFADGKKVEISRKGLDEWESWLLTKEPSWDWDHFDYRIKQEPKYRPYASAEEALSETKKHSFIVSDGSGFHLLTDIHSDEVGCDGEWCPFGSLCSCYVWEDDGTPCGILEEVEETNKTNKKYQPKNKEELEDLVEQLIKERGDNADLNDIDTSLITDMEGLFYGSQFNGNISNWDVSNVTSMEAMFSGSQFNGDISKWNVGKVKNMFSMFRCSDFDGDVSNWNVDNVTEMRFMFSDSPLEYYPPKWYPKNKKIY